jgi:MoCo/4Fe-4S cofactor protein with predicted Tat translocation signal
MSSIERDKMCPEDPEQNRSTKLDLQAIQEKLQGPAGQRFWRCLEEVAETPEYKVLLENEFAHNAEGAPVVPVDALSRRDALRLMAASAAMVGLAGCTRIPTEQIVPYVMAPEDVLPGRPTYYATSMPHSGGMGMGLLVKSNMGRPTKIEGNPQHPASLGATDIFAQASVLTLYDPDRSKTILQDGQPSDWTTFLEGVEPMRAELQRGRGAGLRILTEATSSPTFASRMQAVLTNLPEAKWYKHEPWGSHNLNAGLNLCFGQNVNPVYRFDQATVVVSLDSDFLDLGANCVRYARDFANRRDVESSGKEMNRLYVVESTPTNTGALADHRFAIRCGEIRQVAQALAAGLGLPIAPTDTPGLPTNWASAVAKDLKAHRGDSLILAGETQPPYVHALACVMNEQLGNVGKTVVYTEPVELGPLTDSLPELVSEIRAGKVTTLLILSSNPVYTAPVDLRFAETLLQVKNRIHVGLFTDETAQLCQWHIPETHYLEAWGDTRAYDGTVGIVQPLIAPLYHGVSSLEVLNVFTGQTGASAHDLLTQYWRAKNASMSDKDFGDFWRQTLHDGVMANTAFPPLTLKQQFDYHNVPAENPQSKPGIEIVFRPDPTMGDGRWCNNSWLQELPKPLTKITWDNALMLSPMTAWRLGVGSGEIARMHHGPWELVGPVWVMPGHADDSATMLLGMGRWQAGNVGNRIGINGYLLRTSEKPYIGEHLTLEKTGGVHLMATTQMHHPIDRHGQQVGEESVAAFNRDVIRVGTLEEFRKNPTFAADKVKVEGQSLYPPYLYEGYAWGMSIDLNRCTGCSACMTACYSENNIAVVGKYEVMAGRVMEWIRVDNYYRGDLRNPEMYFEPVPCMHCEMAPCELVCPVGATMHSSEGLNEMIYNRCVGTRYCSNNCPYKVRRFNFKLYSNWNTQSLYPLRNPDVTVRSRGVMEKCTYCVQRINEAKILSEEEHRYVRDGEIQTACQQVCPTRAIIFGNINDHNSEVAKRKESPRNFAMLAELNVRPRTTYSARLRNLNPDLQAT